MKVGQKGLNQQRDRVLARCPHSHSCLASVYTRTHTHTHTHAEPCPVATLFRRGLMDAGEGSVVLLWTWPLGVRHDHPSHPPAPALSLSVIITGKALCPQLVSGLLPLR